MTRRILLLKRATVALSGIGALLLADASAAWADPGWELEALNVPAAWSESKGEGVGVAVIDSGIRVDHPALAGRAEEGPDLLGETDQRESHYGDHGTAMASQVLDVAPEARVVGLRAIRDREDPDYNPDEFGRRTSPVANAIVTAVDAKVSVVLMSLGSTMDILSYNEGETIALRYAASQGVVVVAAAGNEGDGTNNVSYPANYPGVVAVAASTRSGTRAEFSNVHSYVDVIAPGEGVSVADIATGGRSEGDGTSSAAAYVAGVAALITSAYPDLAAWQVEEVLHRTASHYDRGHDAKTGYGRVDAAAALEEAGRLEPRPALISPVAHEGPSHLGPGDDGTPPGVNAGLETEMLVIAAVFGAVALVMLGLGGTLISRSRRGRGDNAHTPGNSPTGRQPGGP